MNIFRMIKSILGAYCADMHKVFIFTNKNEMNPFREDSREPQKETQQTSLRELQITPLREPHGSPFREPKKNPRKTPIKEHQRNRTHTLNL